MKYYLITYAAHGVGDQDYRETNREEFPEYIPAMEALAGKVGWSNLFAARDENQVNDKPYWVTDTEGYAVASEMEVDPLG